MSSTSLLSYVRSQVTVDVDSMDPDVAARHTPCDSPRFCDMTSNQAIVFGEAARPERLQLLEKACAQVQSSQPELDIDTQVSDVIDLLTVLLAKEVYPYLTGRVHAQTSPSTAYNTEATIQHAKKLVSIFEANGIPRSRVCIKIPATPESVVACQHLERLGIRTLATCLFSVAQAMAAHQAGCLYIAPYFNELRVHFEPGVWKEYADTAKEHPAAGVIKAVVQLYKTIGATTLIMPASIVTAKEVIALVSLKPDHLTLSGAVLDQLAAAQSTDLKAEISYSAVESNTKELDVKTIQFLDNGGSALREAIAADSETTRKLTDALKIFGEMEVKTKELIRAKLQS